MPNLPVDVDSWGRSACYPYGNFCPMSNGPSMRSRRITKPDFRPCSTCLSCSQAPFCLYTRWLISDQPEGTIGRLRYSLGGDRPSQTAQLKLFPTQISWNKVSMPNYIRVVSQRCLQENQNSPFKGSHLSCADIARRQFQPTVKLNRVFLSWHA